MSWAEEQWWFGLEDLALEAEEQEEDAKSKIERGIWFQRGGVPISLKQMTYRHICNCINMIENGRLCRKWALPYLKADRKEDWKMAAVSKNKYDVYNWIIKVIESIEIYSEHIERQQRKACVKLIDNFYNVYNDDFLHCSLQQKYYSILRNHNGLSYDFE